MPLFESVQFHISSCVPPERQEQLLHVLKSNGAIEANSLDEATHVITTSHRFEGWQEVNENVNVVTDKWVDKSLVLGKLQSPEHYSADPSMLFSGVVACATELPATDLEVLSAGITALGGQWRTGLTKDVTHLFALSPTSQKYATALHFREHTHVKILLPHWFDDAVRLGNGNLVVAPYEWPDPPLLKGTLVDDDPKGKKLKHETEPDAIKRSIYATATTYTPTAEDPSLPNTLPMSAKPVWADRRILLSRSLQLYAGRRQAVEAGITRGGGQVVRYSGDDENLNEEVQDRVGKIQRLREKQLKNEEANAVDQCDILVTRWRGGKAYKRALETSKTIGSLAWLFHVQHTGVLSRPLDQLLHYPIPKKPIEGFAAHEITLTNYTGEAREYLKKLITAMGATFTPSMTAKNTVLIAAFQSGTKATKAASWSLPVVNHTWLEDCFVQWRMLTVALEKYIVFPPGVDFSSLLGERGLGARAVELMDEDLADSDDEVDEEDIIVPPVGTENSARDANEVEGLVEGLFDRDIDMQDGDVDDSMAIAAYPAVSEQEDYADPPVPKAPQIAKTPTKFTSKAKSKSPVKTQSKSTSGTRKVPRPASSSEEEEIELPPARPRSKSVKGVEPKSAKTKQSTQVHPAAQEEEEEEEDVVQVKSGRSKPMPKANKKASQKSPRRKPQSSKRFVISDEDPADDADEMDRMSVDSDADGATNAKNAASDEDSQPPRKAKTTSPAKVKPKPQTYIRKDKPQVRNRKQAEVNDQEPSSSEPEIIEPRKKLIRRVTREDLTVNDVDQDSGHDSKTSPKNTKSGASKNPTGLLKTTKGDARTRVKKKPTKEQETLSSEEDNVVEEDNSEVEISVRAISKGKSKGKPVASKKAAKDGDHEEISTRQMTKKASRAQPESSEDDVELPTSVLASKPRTTRSAAHAENVSPTAKLTPKRVVSVLMPSLKLSSKSSPSKSSPPKGIKENGAVDEDSPTKRLTRMESVRVAAGEQASRPTPTPVASGSGRKVSSPSKPKPKMKAKVAEPSPTPSTNSVVPPRRSAATKAEQKLRDEVMPDVMNFQQEMRKARRSGGGMNSFTPLEETIASAPGRRKRLSVTTDVSEKDDDDDDDERAKKRRKIGVASNTKEKGKRPMSSEEETRTATATVTGKGKKIVKINVNDSEGEDNAESEPSPPPKMKDNGKMTRNTTDISSKAAKATKKSTSPKLMTTQVNLSIDVQKVLGQLGVRFTARAAECTHLLAPHLVRTEKFLCALANAPYILTEKWALDSAAVRKLLPEEDYLLRDKAGEKKYNFKLSEAMERARASNGKIFAKTTFYVTPKVPVDVKLLKNVVSAGGGQVTTQTPTARVLASSTDRYVISCPEDISIWRPIAMNDYPIFTQELILNGALKQEIDWDNESFRVPDSVF